MKTDRQTTITFSRKKYNYVYTFIVIGKIPLTNKWHSMIVACGAFVINKRRWLILTPNQVSVALIVSADACMQGVQGSNLADD